MGYFLHIDKAKISIGPGIGYNFSTYPTQLFTSVNSLTGSISREENFPQFEKSWIGFYARLGATVSSKVDIGVTGRIGGSSLNYVAMGDKGISISVQVHYLFN